MEGWQCLLDDLASLIRETDEDLAPVGGVRMPFDQAAALERIKQRGHAGAADEEALSNHMGGERLAGAFEDCERLLRAGGQPRDLAYPPLALSREVGGDPYQIGSDLSCGSARARELAFEVAGDPYR